jgi:hypothetical protein
MATNPEGHSPRWWRKHPKATQEATVAQHNHTRPLGAPPVKADKFNEVLGLISFAFTVASWGWTVIAPNSSTTFGSCLFFVAVLSMLAAIFRVWSIGIIRGSVLVIATLAGFVAFDWYVVIKPQKGKEFKALLECLLR